VNAAALVAPLRLAEFVYPAQHPLAGRSGVVFAFAVRHREGVFVFDTGIGTGHAWVEEHYRPRVRRIDDALAEAGIRLTDVGAIANSHLHFDHCGQNHHFPGVPIFVQRAEWEASRADGYTIREWVDFPGARYELVEGDREVLPGLRLVATPGHTPGHQSVALETPEGLVVLAGHAESSPARVRELRAARVLPAHGEAA
jgi:N-acyl homoserine lactone hydrolase